VRSRVLLVALVRVSAGEDAPDLGVVEPAGAPVEFHRVEGLEVPALRFTLRHRGALNPPVMWFLSSRSLDMGPIRPRVLSWILGERSGGVSLVIRSGI